MTSYLQEERLAGHSTLEPRWLNLDRGVLHIIYWISMTIVNNRKERRGGGGDAADFIAAAMVVPEKSAILVSAYYAGLLDQGEAHKIVHLQIAAHQ